MTQPRDAAPPAARRALGLAAGLAVLLVLGGTAGVVAWRRHQTTPPDATAAAADGDPRLSYATPFRNVRPDVQYVGDAACAACHADLSGTFHRHPMGRSMVPVSRAATADRAVDATLARLLPGPLGPLLARTVGREVDRLTHNPFTVNGREFRVEREGDRVFHAEAVRDGRGRVVAEVREEVRYDVGGGRHGHSYLVERDGCLYESPISWFSRAQRWDLSPGFTADDHFTRPVNAECLFCHSSYADAVEHTRGRYRTPIFRGPAIGCERCHGPGALHVQARERGDVVAGGVDDTIVNPKHLEPALREAVCQQCHLEGAVRVLRRGRQPFDFRPGLPLQLFYTVFVQSRELPGRPLSVSQVEQTAVSRCNTGSGGRLLCVTCHDPHVEPPAAERVAYYRDRCRQCHTEGGNDCTLPPAERRPNGDDCTACHMPRTPNADVAHSAATDHRILRRPGAGEGAAGPSYAARPGELPFVPFHRDLPGPAEREVRRDLGLALTTIARQMPGQAAPVCARALPLLEDALAAWPDDLAAREAEVFALTALRRPEEALQAGEEALSQAPDYEPLLPPLAELCQQLGRPRDSLAYCRRALAIVPSSTVYLDNEAGLLLQLGDREGAIAAARRAARLDPLLADAHAILAAAYAGGGRADEARRELDVLAALDPTRAEGLRRQLGIGPP